MYIHFFHNLIQEPTPTKEYKKQLKKLTPLNLRRASKYNTVAVLGALECMEDKKFEQNELGIYVASEFSCATEVANAVTKVNTQEIMPLMPFDFLNVNSNNVGFYIAKALDAQGKNTVITSQDLSFEKALQIADFELEADLVKAVLIGGVDVSIKELSNYQSYLPQKDLQPHDGSCWIYASNQSKDAIAKIEDIQEFCSVKELKSYIQSFCDIDISMNTFAKNDTHLSAYNCCEFEDERYIGVESAPKVVQALQRDKTLFISKARNGSFTTFLVVKMLPSHTR